MKAKATLQLINGFQKIVSGGFGLDDVRMLFIDLRQFLNQPLLKEIAHYIAHPEGRTQGISHREIDLNYMKASRVTGKSPTLRLSPINDYMMQLWQYGIDQTRATSAKHLFGMDKQQAKKLVTQSYVRTGDNWVLSAAVANAGLGTVMVIQKILHGVFNALGPPKPLFAQEAVTEELKRVVRKLALADTARIVKAIGDHETDICVCLLCALQHADLVLTDGTRANLCWGQYDGTERLALFSNFRARLAQDYGGGEVNIHIYPFTSAAKLGDYYSGVLEPDLLLMPERGASGTLSLVRI